jgi:AcrB/AcrD/AcrF family
MSRFFINRPIVAMVIAILTVIIGAITILGLPISQFPRIWKSGVFTNHSPRIPCSRLVAESAWSNPCPVDAAFPIER